jgi:hypothetical protein
VERWCASRRRQRWSRSRPGCLQLEQGRRHSADEIARHRLGRRAILEPDNDVIHAAYAQIHEPLRTERDGQALKLIRYTSGQDNVDELRYRLVL